jgi:GTP:adenosylcobinamide-phosphate guanylyltransferase
MAGGKASRFAKKVEKAILEIRGRTLLERSLEALHEGGADDILVAVTDRVPQTKALAMKLRADTIMTKGTSYHGDILELLERYNEFLSLNVDVPFVNGNHVRELTRSPGSGSRAAVIPASIAMMKSDEDSILVDDTGWKMLWIGLNIVTPEPKTALRVFDDPLLSININNEEDLVFARRIAKERGL